MTAIQRKLTLLLKLTLKLKQLLYDYFIACSMKSWDTVRAGDISLKRLSRVAGDISFKRLSRVYI